MIFENTETLRRHKRTIHTSSIPKKSKNLNNTENVKVDYLADNRLQELKFLNDDDVINEEEIIDSVLSESDVFVL